MAIEYRKLKFKDLKLTRREQLLMLEIGRDMIDTASSFVDYIQEHYGFSKSSIWYCLNRLKETGFAQFANKLDQGRPLSLTKVGLMSLRELEAHKNAIIKQFSDAFMHSFQRKPTGRIRQRQNSYATNSSYA